MSDLETLLAERAIERLIFEYCRLVDSGEAARIADLFIEDGQWIGLGLILDGREKIREWFTDRQSKSLRVSRHFNTNVVVNLTSATEADGACYLINYRRDRQSPEEALPMRGDIAKYVGECQDQYVLTSDGWRFARRQVDVAFIRRPPGGEFP